MVPGDYVLATKYSDGDPHDQWAIGFYVKKDGNRHFVDDGNGELFRRNGFRRAQKITALEGSFLLGIEDIENKGISLWKHLESFKNKIQNGT